MCKGKKAAAGGGPAKKEVDPRVPVFMDSANDGDLESVVEIYEAFDRTECKSLLSFINDRK